MIFWKRGNKERIPREVLDTIENALKEALIQVGGKNVQTKVKKDKVESLADAPGDTDLTGALLVAMATITRGLTGLGYMIEGSNQILEASRTFLESGSISGLVIDKIMSRTVNTAIASLEAKRDNEMLKIGVQAIRFFSKIGYTVSVSRK